MNGTIRAAQKHPPPLGRAGFACANVYVVHFGPVRYALHLQKDGETFLKKKKTPRVQQNRNDTRQPSTAVKLQALWVPEREARRSHF